MEELASSATHNQPEYSVSEIAAGIKRVIEGNFGYVRVRGELSGFKRAASGHLYMDLKDDKALINAVCWKGNAAKLGFAPEDGLEVIVTGKITTYAGRSNYQIVIERMEPAGIGALMALLEKRKQALAAEGLFDAARKKPLPFMPQHIGVITSPTGAVIRDILHRLQDRFPVRVTVWPVRVQGDGAAEEIAAAVAGFNRLNSPHNVISPHPNPLPKGEGMAAEGSEDLSNIDLLIIARGGGSIEDLWCFNEEIVVRAVAASRIPVISAVGHETDTTLVDFVADKRAPTPTAAAEMAVPVRQEWMLSLQEWQQRMQRALHKKLEQQSQHLQHLGRALPSPLHNVERMAQRLDDWAERHRLSLQTRLHKNTQQLSHATQRLSGRFLLQRISQQQEKLLQHHRRQTQQMQHMLQQQTQRITLASSLLESLNYTQVLKRGFVLVKANARTVMSAQEARSHNMLSLQFHDGELKVVPSENPAPTRSKKAPPTIAGQSQSSLFDAD
jgi:exodeoxyribonuclease VII large subunit